MPTLEIEVGVRKGIRPVVSTGNSVSVQLITDDTTNNEEMYIYVIAGTDSGKYLCMLKCVALTPDDNVILTVMLVITRLMSDKKILITCCPSYTRKFIHAIFSSKLSYKDVHGIINKHLLIYR